MKTTLKSALRDYSMLIALAAIWAFFGIEHPVFLSSRNLSLLLIELSITASLALGMLLVLLPGQIDLSAGSGVGLSGALAAVLVFWYGAPAPLALLAGMAACVIVWLAMGSLIVRQKIPAFIITLGGLLVFKGVFWLVIHNATIPVVQGGKTNLYSLLTTFYLPPVIGWALAVIVVACLAFAMLRSNRQRREYGFAT